MSFIRYFTILALVLTAVAAMEGVGKRSLVERQSTCPTAGWIPACPGLFKCVPPGAICCDDNISYAMPPETCPSGTNPITTAGVAPPSTVTTPPAAPSSTQIISLTYFTYEITWYYWYYYFTYIAGAKTTTSYGVTTITTVSVQATGTAQADALFKSLSATIALPTPAQTATAVSGSAPSATTSTPVSTTFAAPSTSSNSSTTTATTSAVQFTGAGTTLRVGPMSHLAELALGVMFVVPGLLMVLL
ncbi:hypothetical protein LSUE1_G000111 [Lachnellula suecica]|uniref:Uncharacterized protein n=1 Tax=Lachnellula suecica TaxID=602035 RepID=A0A8T9CHF3_9HELO|nr:hypothetical protein LSUE1_G000111 [Lachnellula suecica]